MIVPTIHALVLAGGTGTRFWPVSRTARPKQVLPLGPDGTVLLRATIERVAASVDDVWIVTNPVQLETITRVAGRSGPEETGVPADHVLAEPEPRNTAPGILLGCATIEARCAGAAAMILPADHVIEATAERFSRLVQRAASVASDDTTLVTFGIRPSRPATGFGYIEIGDPLDPGPPPVHRVASFREKPDLETSTRYLEGGRHDWNSGMFCWTWRGLRRALDEADPSGALGGAADALLDAVRSRDDGRIADAFARLPATSIDYAVLEKVRSTAVVRCTDLVWHDVGSFAALHALCPTDADGNGAILAGGSSVVPLSSRDCTVYADDGRTIALLGCKDLVVVSVGDAVLVCPRDEAERIRDVVERLQKDGRTDLL